MGCLSNTNISKSLMFMAKGSIHCIEEFEKNAHRELQNSSLCSMLVIKDDVPVNVCICATRIWTEGMTTCVFSVWKMIGWYGILTVRNPMIPSHQIIIHSLCQSSRMYIMFVLRDS